MALAGVLLVLACVSPYYERAEITPGLSGGGGVGASAGYKVFGPRGEPLYVGERSLLATGFLRYGLSRNAGVFIQATSGYGAWGWFVYQQASPLLRAAYLTDIELGAKFRIGRDGAIKAGVGPTGLLDITYLHDFGPNWTGTLGAGFRGFSLGVTNHIRYLPGLLQHASLAVTVFPFSQFEAFHPGAGVFLGLGWEIF